MTYEMRSVQEWKQRVNGEVRSWSGVVYKFFYGQEGLRLQCHLATMSNISVHPHIFKRIVPQFKETICVCEQLIFQCSTCNIWSSARVRTCAILVHLIHYMYIVWWCNALFTDDLLSHHSTHLISCRLAIIFLQLDIVFGLMATSWCSISESANTIISTRAQTTLPGTSLTMSLLWSILTNILVSGVPPTPNWSMNVSEVLNKAR